MAEYWDIYNQDGSKTSKCVKRGDAMKDEEYHLVAHVLILNDQNELLIQKRTMNKESYPGYWDFGVGGSAVCSEDSRTCAHRELLEEVGINHDFSTDVPLLRTYGIHSLIDFYVIHYEGKCEDLMLQQEEVSEVSWASMEKIEELIKQKKFISYHQHLLPLLMEMAEHRGVHD